MQHVFSLVPDFHARLLVVGLALGFMILEYVAGRILHRDNFDVRESAASLGIAVGQFVLRGVEAMIIAVPFAFVYEHRLLDFEMKSVWGLLGLFIGGEFFYYWYHRMAHRVRWLWATHCVHHSATRLNLTAAIRLGWTSQLSGNFLFFLPLAWIGFHPLAIGAMLGVNLIYQFFIHTELCPQLGALEWMLNTPEHHRVHHAKNEACLDKNFGGILILFDRLLGTYGKAPQNETLSYGLVGGQPAFNPVHIALEEWGTMFKDAAAAKTMRGKLNVLLGPPGAI